jgi:transposase-like protein
MIKKPNQRRFSREFKLAAVRSMNSGVNISQL